MTKPCTCSYTSTQHFLILRSCAYIDSLGKFGFRALIGLQKKCRARAGFGLQNKARLQLCFELQLQFSCICCSKSMSFSVGYIKKVSKRQDTDLCGFSTFIPEIWCWNLKNLMLKCLRPVQWHHWEWMMLSFNCSSSLEQWRTQKIFMGRFHSVAYGGHLYLMCAVCDVIIWRHIHVSKPTFWRNLIHNMHILLHALFLFYVSLYWI